MLEPQSVKRQTETRRVRNSNGALAVPEMIGCSDSGDASFPAVQSRRVQCFGRYASTYTGSKFQSHVKILLSIFVKDDYGRMPIRHSDGVCSRVHPCRLKLRREIAFQE